MNATVFFRESLNRSWTEEVTVAYQPSYYNCFQKFDIADIKF